MANMALVILLFTIALAGCKKSESELGQLLFKESRNPVFKEIAPGELAPVLEKMLDEREIKYGELITAFYRLNNYTPVLIQKNLPENGIETLLGYYRKAGEHGQLQTAPMLLCCTKNSSSSDPFPC